MPGLICNILEAQKNYSPVLRTVPTIVMAHTFCASLDTRISYRQCLLIRFCLALSLAKVIVDALISILIISQNKPLS